MTFVIPGGPWSPVEAGRPCGPVAPVEPVAPGGPWIPCGPCGPGGPCVPVLLLSLSLLSFLSSNLTCLQNSTEDTKKPSNGPVLH